MDFSRALSEMKVGKRIARSGWNGAGQYVEMQVPDEHSKMTRPYAYISTVQGDKIPWLVSQGDLFADDWEVV